MEISSKQVSDLRADTGAGMMDCKKALVEAGGDFEEAKKILRKKGLAAAASKAGRAASEGLVVAHVTVKGAVLVEVNCETDFVARTEDFRVFTQKLADRIAAHDAFGDTRSGDTAEALALSWPGGETVHDAVTQLIATLKENIQVRRFARLTARPGERFASYIHGNGRIGVLVGVPGGDDALGKDLAMHIAASDPAFRRAPEVTPEILDDRAGDRAGPGHGRGQSPPTSSSGSPTARSRSSTRRPFSAEQPFVKDPEKTVGQVIVERAGKGTPWASASSGSSWARVLGRSSAAGLTVAAFGEESSETT